MSEYLTLRLSDRPGRSLPWLVWSTQDENVIASGELASIDELDALTSYAQNRTVIGLIDSADVTLKAVEVPKVSAKQLATMLPFVVEDEVAQDPSRLHVVELSRKGRQANLAIMDKSLLHFWKETLERHQITLDKLLPDVTALGAMAKTDTPTILGLGGQWLIHHSQWLGASVDKAHLPLALASEVFVPFSTLTDTDDGATVAVYAQPDAPFESADIRWQAAEPELPMVVLTKGALTSKLNLLSGLFKKPSMLGAQLKLWRSAIVALVAFMAVLVFQAVWQTKQVEEQALAFEQARSQILKQVLPDRRNFPTQSYLKRTMNEEVAKLSGAGVKTSLMSELAAIASVAQQADFAISSLSFDEADEVISLMVSGADFQTFESLREQFGLHYTVSQGALSREGESERVSGQLELRPLP